MGVCKKIIKKGMKVSFHPFFNIEFTCQQIKMRCLTASNIKIPAATETFND